MKALAALFLGTAALLPRLCASQGVTQDTIVLGQAAVFTGPAAQLGIQMRNGIKAYLDYVNEKGGVHGRKLELVTEDDGYEAARAPVAKTMDLVELLGPSGPSCLVAEGSGPPPVSPVFLSPIRVASPGIGPCQSRARRRNRMTNNLVARRLR